MGTIHQLKITSEYLKRLPSRTGKTAAMVKEIVEVLKSGKIDNPDGGTVTDGTKTVAIIVAHLQSAQGIMRMLRQEME